MPHKTAQVYADMICFSALVLGGVILGVACVTTKRLSIYRRIMFGTIALASVYSIARRDKYLPFLGDTAFPCGPLSEKIPLQATVSIAVKTKPNSNIVYWAAEKTDDPVADNPWNAYAKYSNSGVVRSDANGTAILRVRRPPAYKVPPFGKTIVPHVHFRVCSDHGWLDRVQTVYLEG